MILGRVVKATYFLITNPSSVVQRMQTCTWYEAPNIKLIVVNKIIFKWHSFLIEYANPEIRQSTIYYAGLLGRWDKQIIDQESDVPSIIFFILFIDLGHSKLFIFIIEK